METSELHYLEGQAILAIKGESMQVLQLEKLTECYSLLVGELNANIEVIAQVYC